MGFEDLMKQAQQGLAAMPHCDNCNGHLAGGAMTFNDIDGRPQTWCMKCILEAVSVFQRIKKERLSTE